MAKRRTNTNRNNSNKAPQARRTGGLHFEEPIAARSSHILIEGDNSAEESSISQDSGMQSSKSVLSPKYDSSYAENSMEEASVSQIDSAEVLRNRYNPETADKLTYITSIDSIKYFSGDDKYYIEVTGLLGGRKKEVSIVTSVEHFSTLAEIKILRQGSKNLLSKEERDKFLLVLSNYIADNRKTFEESTSIKKKFKVGADPISTNYIDGLEDAESYISLNNIVYYVSRKKDKSDGYICFKNSTLKKSYIVVGFDELENSTYSSVLRLFERRKSNYKEKKTNKGLDRARLERTSKMGKDKASKDNKANQSRKYRSINTCLYKALSTYLPTAIPEYEFRNEKVKYSTLDKQIILTNNLLQNRGYPQLSFIKTQKQLLSTFISSSKYDESLIVFEIIDIPGMTHCIHQRKGQEITDSLALAAMKSNVRCFELVAALRE